MRIGGCGKILTQPLCTRLANMQRCTDGEPTYVALSNGWIIINVGGGRPTTSGLSPWRPRAIPGTSRRRTLNGEPAVPTS
jgi:hypothetical protein